MKFSAGQKVGDYEVLDELGTGGMAEVYRVRNLISQRLEAMKIMLPDMTVEPDFLARFGAEIRTLASLDHPNIAQLRTAFEYREQQIMIMEFVEGRTLDQITNRNPLSPSEVVRIGLQILSALSYAHARGVVHRDIKPANIMLTREGTVKLMDFGIAKSANEAQLTQPGSTLGSFYYISPEQIRGDAVDPRADIYSLGIVFYELLSGQRPFQADTTLALLEQHLHATPQPLSTLRPDLPPVFNDLVLTSMAKAPAARFQSADAFAKALRSIPSLAADTATMPLSSFGRNDPSRVPAEPQRISRAPVASRKPRRALWLLAGALAVIAVFAIALTFAPLFTKTTAGSKRAAVPQPAPSVARSLPVPAPVPAPAVAAQTAAVPPAALRVQPPPSPLVHVRAAPSKTAPVAGTPTVNRAQPALTASPSSPPAATQSPARVAPSAAELERAQDELIQLQSRASAANTSLDHLEQAQAADGLGLRHDISAARARMNTYLLAAADDLAAGNLAALEHHSSQAEKELSTLEAFLRK